MRFLLCKRDFFQSRTRFLPHSTWVIELHRFITPLDLWPFFRSSRPCLPAQRWGHSAWILFRVPMGQGLSDLNSAHLLFGHLILPGSSFQSNLHTKCFCEDALWGDPPQLCDLSCRKSHFLLFVCSFVQCSSFELRRLLKWCSDMSRVVCAQRWCSDEC